MPKIPLKLSVFHVPDVLRGELCPQTSSFRISLVTLVRNAPMKRFCTNGSTDDPTGVQLIKSPKVSGRLPQPSQLLRPSKNVKYHAFLVTASASC